MAFSGTFDCFPDVRREMFAPSTGAEPGFSEILLRYGQRFQADRNSTQASLFGDLEPLETEHPPYPKYEEWAPIQLLDEEKRLVGMYLSAHPLDPYYIDLEYGCNVRAADFKHYEQPGQKVRMGGLVTSLQERISKKGAPWGILTIEDFSGSAEIRLFGKSYLEYKHFGMPGTPIYIEAEFTAGRFNPDQVDFNIHSMGLLTELQGKLIKDMTIYQDADTFIAPEVFQSLQEIMTEASPYSCTLYMEIMDPATARSVKVVPAKRPTSRAN